MKKKQKQKKTQIIIVAVFLVFGLGMALSMLGLARAVVGIDEEKMAREPEAILASAGVESGADINLPVRYFDQKQDACVNLYDANASKAIKERQFEWTSCGYEYNQLEQGIVEYELGEDYLPVAVGGKLTPNRGLDDMNRWFNSMDDKSKEYTGSLKLTYKVDGGVKFIYASNDFYPLEEAEFSANDEINKDGHNHLWTMDFAVPFTVMANGAESFEITADDDTFVFVGTKLILDMGGIHSATTGRLAIHEDGEIYSAVESDDLAYSGLKVAKDEGSIVRIFHADRDAKESIFKIKMNGMNLNVMQTQLASGDNGVQVAYDSSDPSHVQPLGESLVMRPDGTKGYIIMATVFGVVIVMCAVFMVMAARRLFLRR